jgi:recombinational DNA repair protein (RecF pathway)
MARSELQELLERLGIGIKKPECSVCGRELTEDQLIRCKRCGRAFCEECAGDKLNEQGICSECAEGKDEDEEEEGMEWEMDEEG